MADFDRNKFDNTVLYLLQRCSPSRPGVTALLKMIYFADYEHYRRNLAPITGAQYVALERGPVVDGYAEQFERMTAEGTVKLMEVTVLGVTDKKQEYRPLVEPDVGVFSPTEIAILDSVAIQHGSETGAALSEKTHLEGPWSIVWHPYDRGRPIPYAMFRWFDNLPDELDIKKAKAEIESRPEVLETIKALTG